MESVGRRLDEERTSSTRKRQQEKEIVLMARVYLEGKRPASIPKHVIFCCPGASGDDTPTEWWDLSGDKPKPKNYTIEFRHGESEEIPDNLAQYLIETKQAEAEEWREPRSERWGW
jgi:hypothetical protein